jgi:hypothetical protein
MENQAARAFSSRVAYWTSQGLSGSALYERLAYDETLPTFFDPEDIAAIQDVQIGAVKKARHRGTGPAFMRLSGKLVRYPRPDFCTYLASKFVRRAA